MTLPPLSFYTVKKDGSIFDKEGRAVFLSTERFIDLMRSDNSCFLCGRTRDEIQFNAEHIIPDWVQRFCDLRNKSIKLPNGTSFPYPKYIVPCCVECNSYLGDTFESPISRVFSKGNDAVSEFFQNGGIWRIFLWINLIYLKIHLKDNFLRLNRDHRAPDEKIGDLYPWEELHHCHALIRAERFGVNIDVSSVLGSTMALHLGEWANEMPYDYNDHLPSQTIMIRIRNVAFISVLDDACGTLQGLEPILSALPPELNAVQMAELLSEFQFVSMHLKNRPKYRTSISSSSGIPEIVGEVPKIFDLDELNFSIRGELMLRNLNALSPGFSLNGQPREESVALIKSGNVSFIRN